MKKQFYTILTLFFLGLFTFGVVTLGQEDVGVLGEHTVNISVAPKNSEAITKVQTIKKQYKILLDDCEKSWKLILSFRHNGKGCFLINKAIQDNSWNKLAFAEGIVEGSKVVLPQTEMVYVPFPYINVYEEVFAKVRVVISAFNGGYAIFVIGDNAVSDSSYDFAKVRTVVEKALREYSRLMRTTSPAVTVYFHSVK